MTKKSNLFIVSNAITLITSSMIINEKHQDDYNVLMIMVHNFDMNFWNTMTYIANKLGNFSKIVLFDAYRKNPPPQGDIINNSEVFNFQALESDMKTDNFENIYTTYFYIEAQLILDYYKTAKLKALDNGTGSYEPQVIPQNLRDRFDEFYSFNYFGKVIPYEITNNKNQMKNIVINKNDFLKILESFSSDIDINPDPNAVVVCAQNISLCNGVITPKDEFQTYYNIVKNLLDKGYNVYYKDHPKTPECFQKALSSLNNGNLQIMNGSTPLEMVIQKLKPKAIVGIFSSSLLLVPHLFDEISAYTITLENNFSANIAYKYAYALVKSYIPDFKDFETGKTIPTTSTPSNVLPLTNLLHTTLTGEIMDKETFTQIKENIKTRDYEEFEYFNIPQKLFEIFKNADYESLINRQVENYM